MSSLFFVALWSTAGKELTSWLSCVLCFVIFPNVSLSTSESRVRFAPLNWFKPSSKIFLLTVPRWYFFCGSFVLFQLFYSWKKTSFVYLVGQEVLCFAWIIIYVLIVCMREVNVRMSLRTPTVSSDCVLHVWTVNVQTILCARTLSSERSLFTDAIST